MPSPCHTEQHATWPSRDLSPSRREIVQLLEIDGASIVGTKVNAPFGVIPEVYLLPMESVKTTKAEYYKVDPKWLNFEPVPVLKTAKYRELTAVEV
ncbi:hypothetical protein JVU11DRAFT_8974 [Chiua virens]|nr:hypothetical protein JVU11DRAFT_8974 [Chiua virens]